MWNPNILDSYYKYINNQFTLYIQCYQNVINEYLNRDNLYKNAYYFQDSRIDQYKHYINEIKNIQILIEYNQKKLFKLLYNQSMLIHTYIKHPIIKAKLLNSYRNYSIL